MKKIIGAGGGSGKSGKKGGRMAVESPDSLQSRAFVQVIDLIGEGEIEGLVDGHKSIYLDGTPLQNSDDTYNFPGFDIDTRNGSQTQDYIEGVSATEREVAVGVEFTYATPIVRTITNNEVDAVRVRVALPQLSSQNPKNGDLAGSEVTYAIDVQSDGGGYEEKIRDVIIGKCLSKYERSYRIELEGDGPWDIRCRRITTDSVSALLANKTVFEAYTEVVDGKLRYPNSALVAIKVDASQFQSVPVRSYDMKLLRVKVPSNYDTSARTYNGAWDGAFYVAWTDNPAWIFYDLLTNERYGLGGFIPEAQVDKWGLYSIGQYCDELVPDGFGGTEPRFTCNVYFQAAAEAYKVIQDLASCFRGMVYWANGSLTAAQDAPQDPAFLFNPSNVVDGVFAYQGSSAKARHSVAIVTWNDPDDSYRQKVEYVEDSEAMARYGVVEAQVAAFGCSSRGQANRVGKWLLFTEQYQTEIVTFKTGLNGAICRPGDVIKVADPTRAGSRRGGRILSSSGVTINLDQSLSIDPASHTFSAILPDGTIEERQIQSTLNNQVTLSSAFSTDPAPQSIWIISSSEIEPQYFKIIGIQEASGGTHEITALAHNPDKYDAIENDLILEPRSISDLRSVPDSPTGILVTETLYEVNGEVRVKATISWNPVAQAVSYIVQYQKDSQNIQPLPESSSNDLEMLNVEPGFYTFKVFAISPLGIKSVPSTGSKQIIGKALPPNSVENFSIIPMANIAYLSWDKSIDLDVLIGGSVRIRWTPDIVTPTWKNSVDIVPALSGSSSRAQVPLLTGAYMAKFIDSSGVSSDEEALIVTTIPAPLSLNVVETLTEHGAFSGAKTDMAYFSEYEGLALEANTLVDDIVMDVDDVVNWDFAGGVGSEGEYEFSNPIDLGEVFSSRVTAHIKAIAVDVADFIDMREDDIDDWQDIDGDFIDDVNAEIYLRTTVDDPADLGAAWTAWKKFFVGEYLARGYQFKVVAKSDQKFHNVIIQELSVTVDMPDRIENFPGVSSGAGPYNVTYTFPFKEEPTIGITASNLSSGDFYEITSETREGFQIVFKNSSGTPVSRMFNVLAKGYGRQAV
jgi:predicted phage tail protein